MGWLNVDEDLPSCKLSQVPGGIHTLLVLDQISEAMLQIAFTRL